jgi:DNA-binding NtrC family response regulator
MSERRALVVDDDVSIRLLVSRVLSRSDYMVDTARDGAEALEKIAAEDFSVIVLDLMMPRIDGLGVITHLTQFRPEMIGRVVITTAFGEGAVERVCPPVVRFLEKPFDIERLLREVNDCCEEYEKLA